MGAAAVLGLGLHLWLNLFGGVANPAVSASYAIIASIAFTLLSLSLRRVLLSRGSVEGA